MKAVIKRGEWYGTQLFQEIRALSLRCSRTDVFMDEQRKLLLQWGIGEMELSSEGEVLLEIVDRERWTISLLRGLPAKTTK